MPNVTFSGQADGATLIAAPAAGCFIRVLGGELSSAAAIVTATLKSDTAVIWETKGMGATPFAATIPTAKQRTIDCEPGKALKLGLSGGAASGNLQYAIYGKQQV